MQMTNRAFYMTMLQSSCEYMFAIYKKVKREEWLQLKIRQSAVFRENLQAALRNSQDERRSYFQLLNTDLLSVENEQE